VPILYFTLFLLVTIGGRCLCIHQAKVADLLIFTVVRFLQLFLLFSFRNYMDPGFLLEIGLYSGYLPQTVIGLRSSGLPEVGPGIRFYCHFTNCKILSWAYLVGRLSQNATMLLEAVLVARTKREGNTTGSHVPVLTCSSSGRKWKEEVYLRDALKHCAFRSVTLVYHPAVFIACADRQAKVVESPMVCD